MNHSSCSVFFLSPDRDDWEPVLSETVRHSASLVSRKSGFAEGRFWRGSAVDSFGSKEEESGIFQKPHPAGKFHSVEVVENSSVRGKSKNQPVGVERLIYPAF